MCYGLVTCYQHYYLYFSIYILNPVIILYAYNFLKERHFLWNAKY